MADYSTRKVLSVFLASPSDLNDERKTVRAVVDEINETFRRRLQWHIELLGWEDTLPGYGRPQELINLDVDACDLFVGLLWRRWGQPTGEYSSGFEEEYVRAMDRRQRQHSPQIWLFFKRVEPDQLGDPGEQLQRVLTFKQIQQASRAILFKDFNDPDDLEKQLRPYLSQYILDLREQAQTTIPANPESVTPIPSLPSPAVSTAPSPPDGQNQKVTARLDALLNRVADAVNAGDLRAASVASLEEFEIARLCLLAGTLLSERFPDELMGVRLVNLLYQYRDKLGTLPKETRHVFRSLISRKFDLLPGWYWFRDWNEDTLATGLSHVATIDPEPAFRAQAIDLCSRASIVPREEDGENRAFFQTILRDDSETVRESALKYVATAGSRQELPLIEPLLSDSAAGIRAAAAKSKLMILARTSPVEALEYILAVDATIDAAVFSLLEDLPASKTEQLLRTALKDSRKEVRFFAVKQLAKFHLLTKELAIPLLDDPSLDVRETCIHDLIESGLDLDSDQIRKTLETPTSFFRPRLNEPDKLVELKLQRLSFEALTALLDWLSLDGPVAYRVLATRHFSKVADRIRSDLRDRFEAIRTETYEKLKQVYAPLIEKKKEELERLDPFVRGQFTAAALAGLAEHGDHSDLQLARQFLSDESSAVKTEAIRIIARFGDSSDVGALTNIAKTGYGEPKILALDAALKLLPGPSGSARDLLETDDEDLVRASVESLREQDVAAVAPLIEPLLTSPNESKRLEGLEYFILKYSTQQLEDLLIAYLQKDSYYYNVVCWLDRILYAPPPLGSTYRKEFESKKKT